MIGPGRRPRGGRRKEGLAVPRVQGHRPVVQVLDRPLLLGVPPLPPPNRRAALRGAPLARGAGGSGAERQGSTDFVRRSRLAR